MKILVSPGLRYRRNAYNHLLYSHMTRHGVVVKSFNLRRLLFSNYHLWHIHWPEALLNQRLVIWVFFNVLVLLGLVVTARARGIKVVWTVHNLMTHERYHPRLEQWFWNSFMKKVDGYICLTRSGMQRVIRRFPVLRSIPGFVVPHGHYRDIYPATVSRDHARRHAGYSEDHRVLLFIGQIRPYKNVPQLLQVFHRTQDPELRLHVVGRPNSFELQRKVAATAATDPRSRLTMRYVADEELQYFLHSADLVVLPYDDILNSGSALLALSFDVPVLLPDKGAMRELQQLVGSDWVRLYDGELSPHILADAAGWARDSRRPARLGLKELDWDRLAHQTARAYDLITAAC
jgi:glycosyltransferase involved in cell wall biosynthesis